MTRAFVLFESTVSDAEMGVYRRILSGAEWKVVDGRDYQTADVTARMPGVKRAFFVRLMPLCVMHPHVDAGDCNTDHVVLQTNPWCKNWWGDDDSPEAKHMEQGWRYTVDRTVRHWASNMGDTPRIHLLVEY